MIDVTGAPGLDGSDAVGANPATPGGNGADATAAATAAEASNQATATGGAGGLGGNPIPGSATDIGGNGGNGGAASAQASAFSSVGGASASAIAAGGAGGNGGGNLDPTTTPGAGGDGGAAQSHAIAESIGGPADALARATGGAAGLGGLSLRLVAGTTPTFVTYNGPSGRAGGATAASASANAGAGDASASATATGHSPDATSQAISATGAAHSDATASGEGAMANSDAPADGTTASAFAHGAGPAEAIALAHGNVSNTGYAGGGATASARAESETGPATARATQIGGNAPPSIPPDLFGYLPSGGGPGVDSNMLDAVSGSSPGTLTLYQEAVASPAANAFDGGNASSVLHAQNPGGGALAAEVTARAGATDVACLSRGAPTVCNVGTGGQALAQVDALGPTGQDVDARAHALGGLGGVVPYIGGVPVVMNPGPATATATAHGDRSVFAHADATTDFGAPAHAQTSALSAGPITSAAARLDLVRTTPSTYTTTSNSLASAAAQAGIAAPTSAAGLPALASVGGSGRLFAAPRAPDVAAAFAGNPNSLAALAGRGALALGSLDGRIGAFSFSEEPAPYSMSLSGSLALELSSPALASTPLSIAFLDPTALGAGGDQLVLSISLDGTLAFSGTFDGAAAIAALDDTVHDLGAVSSSGQSELVLSWSADLAQGADPTSFALDFALIGASVPEPGALGLTALALGVAALRRSRRATSGS